jgi:hypothetical protein
MRKQQSQYKVCGRLGYNAMLRLWSGKTKKWQKHVMYSGTGNEKRSQTSGTNISQEQKKVVNPVVGLTNERRRGVVDRRTRSTQGKKRESKSRLRRKDMHGRVQGQKTGRKRRYGGVKIKEVRKNVRQQRKEYQEVKSMNERGYRKGRSMQAKQSHRRSRTEIRVDVRRWRSGRVPTLQMGRDLIEHGHVNHVERNGELGKVAEWQGARVEVGHGRKVNDGTWKKIKERSTGLLKEEEYAKTAVMYREVDYVTGRRVLLRKPRSNEVVIPKGMEISVWTCL